jgi:hypothetical protein
MNFTRRPKNSNESFGDFARGTLRFWVSRPLQRFFEEQELSGENNQFDSAVLKSGCCPTQVD